VLAPAFGVLETLAWFVPSTLLATLLSLVAAKPLARRLGTRPFLAGLLVFSVGAVLAATITPSAGAFEVGAPAGGTCDLGRIRLASIQDLRSINETSLNIALFVPLGLVVGFLPAADLKRWLLAAAIALPFAIEGLQLVAPALGRSCQAADVIDNLTGVMVGETVGFAILWLVMRATRAANSSDPT
jgi:hypothetical protein